MVTPNTYESYIASESSSILYYVWQCVTALNVGMLTYKSVCEKIVYKLVCYHSVVFLDIDTARKAVLNISIC